MDVLKGPKSNESYSAKDIEVLEGLEPVRKRPGMYIGGTDENALHHLATEILDNAMDEAVAGYAKKITVTLLDKNTLSILDDGRGIPIDPHPKFPTKSALEVILTTLHSGGKFNQKAYETAGGLHGVGISVVNALSSHLKATVYKNRQAWSQEYAYGLPTTSLVEDGKAPIKNGTCITFTPDPTIFEKADFDSKKLRQLIRSKAFLYKGVAIHWKPYNGEEEVFQFTRGLLDYLEQDSSDEENHLCFNREIKDTEGRLECAIIWPISEEEPVQAKVTSFCNTILTPQGGTHESGFRQALVKAVRDYGERINFKQSNQIIADDIMASCQAALSVFIKNPQFQGQTKEKLVTTGTSKWVEGLVKDEIDHWLTSDPQSSLKLLEHIASFTRERLQRKQSKEITRQSATKRLRLPGKLADCTQTNSEVCELFLVEGDSAGGSAKQARNRQTQAVLPLKGKILNVATASLDKMQANQEVRDLILAIGCGFGNDINLSQLRYHKIVIMTDADVDGAHIASLLLTFFYLELTPLIEHGHIYLAQPPLYRISQGSKIMYAVSDLEKDNIIQQHFQGKGEVTRFKGLGEMPMQQLRTTTMDPQNRSLLRVTTQQASNETKKFVEHLMGKQAEARFKFIQENASFARNIDV